MIALRDKDTGADLGTITEEQLQFLVDQLEEEYAEDRTTTSIARCSTLCGKTTPTPDSSTSFRRLSATGTA